MCNFVVPKVPNWFFPYFFASCVIVSTDAGAALVAKNPIQDAFVTTGPTNNLSSNNYGAAGALSVAAAGLPKGEFRSVVKFNGADFKNDFDTQFGTGQWFVQSITLTLTSSLPNNSIFNSSTTPTNPSNVPGNFGIKWMSVDTFTGGTGNPSAPTTDGITFNTLISTYDNPADQALGTFNFPGGNFGSNIYTLNLSPGLLGDFQAGTDIGLQLFAADSSVAYVFNSNNFGTISSRPLLTVNAVPEPGSKGFCLMGLALFLFYLRKRRFQT